jgi:hypothetical protein
MTMPSSKPFFHLDFAVPASILDASNPTTFYFLVVTFLGSLAMLVSGLVKSCFVSVVSLGKNFPTRA